MQKVCQIRIHDNGFVGLKLRVIQVVFDQKKCITILYKNMVIKINDLIAKIKNF
jgi:hypothetical protein